MIPLNIGRAIGMKVPVVKVSEDKNTTRIINTMMAKIAIDYKLWEFIFLKFFCKELRHQPALPSLKNYSLSLHPR